MHPLPPGETRLPAPKAAGARPPEHCYLLYVHVPFCERLCPYCSFCRYPFNGSRVRAYFAALRQEMHMLKQLGYNFGSMYIGGGTPTILPDELFSTIDLARDLFDLREVSCETNPNHLLPAWLNGLEGRVQRLSVGIQSFDDNLLAQMQRLDKYGSGLEILERLQATMQGWDFKSLNADMIFNFPSQTSDMLERDLAFILESGVNQTTFYPLMASAAVERSLAATVGRVDYRREAQFYEIISEVLAGSVMSAAAGTTSAARGTVAPFTFGSAWTFNASANSMIDEYIIDYEEYPAIGAGGFSYLDGSLYSNTFSVDEYIRRVNAGKMSVVSKRRFTLTDRMRYRLMMQLFGLRLDKLQWKRDFGVSVERGLPAEYNFFKAAGAFATDTLFELTLTPKGRYLLLAMMRSFFIGVNSLRDQARNALPPAERELIFG
jgi:coproporphyrinogen III oxidase-like Fe-S oxidoreductase